MTKHTFSTTRSILGGINGVGYIIITMTGNIMFGTFFSCIVSRESWLTPVTEPNRVIQPILVSYNKG